MKLTLAAAGALGLGALAFPPGLFEQGLDEDQMQAFARIMAEMPQDQDLTRRQLGSQPISTSGEHEFVPPGPGDERGPCPGLNALANHGYLPHNGKANPIQYAAATSQVYGLGPIPAAVLAAYGTASTIDFPNWSMGGGTSFLGRQKGISYTHNIYEVDASVTRGDVGSVGNGFQLQLDNFKMLYNSSLGPNGLVPNDMHDHAVRRRENSKQTNPTFLYSPVTVLVNFVAHGFVTGLMSNWCSQGHSSGFLDGETLKSFFAVEGENPDTFVYREGHERIPNGWCRRPLPWTSADIIAFSAAGSVTHPELLGLGGNLGRPNSFVGLDLSTVTGGAFKKENLFEGNNFGCLAYRTAQDVAPGMRNPGILAAFTSMVAPYVTGLNCPSMTIDREKLAQFPGAKDL
ncbi:hypothetical protein CDD82_7105 [Ophiocordyceps australis]|uniref:Heme haloperoxidase family profile domain-containing protein n=1 Tax=Ophiocordyceps australis TaxID=1399860 RepID=A0A2C5YS30_9HYPO|nr:hypothetical protein CDD82_7105 [Ophiocordyceps australis]